MRLFALNWPPSVIARLLSPPTLSRRGMAPMLCALFLAARMRALQMDPVSGNPQRSARGRDTIFQRCRASRRTKSIFFSKHTKRKACKTLETNCKNALQIENIVSTTPNTIDIARAVAFAHFLRLLRWAQNCFWYCSGALLLQTIVSVTIPYLLNGDVREELAMPLRTGLKGPSDDHSRVA